MNRQIQPSTELADIFTGHRGPIATENATAGTKTFGTLLHGIVFQVCKLAGLLLCATSGIHGVTISISDADFTSSPVFSNVVTYDVEINIAVPLQPGLVSDPSINNIQYSINGALGQGTVSGFVFHFNGREKGTGRYHPLFLQLFSDGTGLLQNADNRNGINPATKEVVDVDFGDEYNTNLSFDASSITIIEAPICGLPAPILKKSDQENTFDIVSSSEPGFFYQLQRSTNLNDWADNGLPVSGSSSQDLRFNIDQTGFFPIKRTIDFSFSE